MSDTDALDAGLRLETTAGTLHELSLMSGPVYGRLGMAIQAITNDHARLHAALRAERVRGEESMRERAAKAANDEAEAVEALDAFEIGPLAGPAKAQSRHTANRIAAAIKALPTTDKETTHG